MNVRLAVINQDGSIQDQEYEARDVQERGSFLVLECERTIKVFPVHRVFFVEVDRAEP